DVRDAADRALWKRQLADAYKKEPQTDHAVLRCIEAWDLLGTERQNGFSVGPIPVSKVVWWCTEVLGLDRDMALTMARVIHSVDNERAEARAKDKELEDATGKGRRGARR